MSGAAPRAPAVPPLEDGFDSHVGSSRVFVLAMCSSSRARVTDWKSCSGLRKRPSVGGLLLVLLGDGFGVIAARWAAVMLSFPAFTSSRAARAFALPLSTSSIRFNSFSAVILDLPIFLAARPAALLPSVLNPWENFLLRVFFFPRPPSLPYFPASFCLSAASFFSMRLSSLYSLPRISSVFWRWRSLLQTSY